MKVNPKQIRKIFGLPKYAVRQLCDMIDSMDKDQIDGKTVTFAYFIGKGIYFISSDDKYKDLQGAPVICVLFPLKKEERIGKDFNPTISACLEDLKSDNYHYTYEIVLFSEKAKEGSFSWDIPLEESLDHQRIYFGKTSQGVANRLRQHLYSMVSGKSRLYRVSRDLGLSPSMVLCTGAFASESEALDHEEELIDEGTESGSGYCLNVMKNRWAYEKFINFFGRRPKSTEMCEEQFAEEYNKQDRIMGSEQRMAIADRDRDFTDQEVKSIRLLLAMGEPPRVIADKMNVRHERVNDIINDRTYRKKGLIS